MALKGSDIAQHNNADSCWVIIHVRLGPGRYENNDTDSPSQGKAYDVTDFLPGW